MNSSGTHDNACNYLPLTLDGFIQISGKILSLESNQTIIKWQLQTHKAISFIW